MEEKICLFLGGILLGLLITAVIYALFAKNLRYFNTNRFKCGSKDKIVPILFHVEKIEEACTQYEESIISKPLWKYTIGCHFFLKANNKQFIYDKYIFWDEPEKYKIGDILTLSQFETLNKATK